MFDQIINSFIEIDKNVTDGGDFMEIEKSLKDEIPAIYAECESTLKILDGNFPEGIEFPPEIEKLDTNEKVEAIKNMMLTKFMTTDLNKEMVDRMYNIANEYDKKYQTNVFMNFIFALFESSLDICKKLDNKNLIDLYTYGVSKTGVINANE